MLAEQEICCRHVDAKGFLLTIGGSPHLTARSCGRQPAMTLTPSRPVPPATTAAQQRLEVELLLGEAVLAAEELAAAGNGRWELADVFNPDQCRQLGCLPVGREGDALLIAVPTQWTPQQRQHLLDLAAAAGLTLSLRLALQGEIQAELERPASPTPAIDSRPDENPDLASFSEADDDDMRQPGRDADALPGGGPAAGWSARGSPR